MVLHIYQQPIMSGHFCLVQEISFINRRFDRILGHLKQEVLTHIKHERNKEFAKSQKKYIFPISKIPNLI